MTRVFYFGVVLWGEEFRDYFLRFCLPSLLAPGNIPSLPGGAEHRFLICTPREDWERMREHPAISRLARHMRPEWLELAPPQAEEPKMRAMSRGHKLVAEAMYEARAYGTYVYPDTVFADGLIAEALRWADRGKKAVLAHCPRFANEGLLNDLVGHGYVQPGEPIVLKPRELIALALPHMHSETRRHEWDAPWFYAESPSEVWWRVPGDGLLVHTLAWAPVLVDYGAVPRHDTTALESWTIDGDYVHRNFPDRADVHAVLDSDDMALMSFTPEARLSFLPLRQARIRRIPILGEIWRTLAVRTFVQSTAIDPLKRLLFVKPVRVHAGAIDPSWEYVERNTQTLIATVLQPLSPPERILFFLLHVLRNGLARCVAQFLRHKARQIKEDRAQPSQAVS